MRPGGACFKDFRARGAFGILEDPVLLHDERAAQRNHHENAEQSAEHRDKHDARDFQVEAQYENRRHRDADAERNRLTGGASCLHDVVFENRGIAPAHLGEEPEERDRNDRHGDGRADGQPHFEHQVQG